jgi:hypothetical protein
LTDKVPSLWKAARGLAALMDGQSFGISFSTIWSMVKLAAF